MSGYVLFVPTEDQNHLLLVLLTILLTPFTVVLHGWTVSVL